MGTSPERFNFQDAGLVNFDRPRFPHNIGSVGIFEGVIPFEKYLAHVERRLELVPRYRQRMMRVPFDLSHPVWHEDPHFDIRRHVKAVRLPEPGDEEQLARLAGEFLAAPLDREKPLWEMVLVQGVGGERTAHIVKVHHCMVDGVAGVQLLAALLDPAPEPRPMPRRQRRAEGAPPPGRAALLADALFHQVSEQLDMAEGLLTGLLQPTSFVRWGQSVAGALWAAAPYALRPAPRTPWSTRLTSPRRLSWQHLPLAEVRAVSKALGGTVNDVVLTVLAGALGRYLDLHGWRTDGLVVRALIPVDVRTEEEGQMLGNRVSLMLAGLPVGLADPWARFHAVHRGLTSLKQRDQAGGIDNLLRALSRIPAPVQALLGSRLTAPNVVANLLCTNVRGPQAPLYCLGHRMTGHYPWVLLTWRMGLSVAVMSYDQGLYFSITADAAVLPDVERLAGSLGEAFRELRDVALGPERGRVAGPERESTVPVRLRGNGASPRGRLPAVRGGAGGRGRGGDARSRGSGSRAVTERKGPSGQPRA